VAVVLTLVLTYGAYGESHPAQVSDKVLNGHPAPAAPPAAYLLVVAAGLALAVWRRYPLPALAVSVAATSAYSLLGYVNGSVILAPVITLYAVTRTLRPRRALIVAAVTLAVLLASSAAGNPFGMTGGGFILIAPLVAVALLGGIAVSNRNAYIASIGDRAQDEARRRADEERLRLARDLHDGVAHTMATISVQAAMAAQVLDTRPAVAAEALQTIRGASKDGLRELRTILNVLRQADEGDPVQPAPGLAQLAALAAGATRAGLPVTVRRCGPDRSLPAPVDVTAYRIVQESLTNAIRHAGPATATVVVSYAADELRIEVTDDGAGPGNGGTRGGGHGLPGMRERAAAVGGAVEYGPGPAGGFQVTARLPVAAEPVAAAPVAAEPAPPEPTPAGGNGGGAR
jgi:signal transduction histidine kinase